MQYARKPHSHIVPAGYLRAWTDGKQVAMRRVGSPDSVPIGVRHAGVRKDFYRRQRPATGDTIYDVEWSLEKRRLVTSDHPVVVWPLARDQMRPVPNDLDAGVTDTLEVFAPLAPDALLLMTWRHDKDFADPIRGAGRHARTANAFVVANADEQWFHEPGVQPWLTKGKRNPLSPDLIVGYRRLEAEQSPRRTEPTAPAGTTAETEISNDPLPMVTVTNAAPTT